MHHALHVLGVPEAKYNRLINNTLQA